MSMSVALKYTHPKGAAHIVTLFDTPTSRTYGILGFDPEVVGFDAPAGEYAEVRDRYLEWVRVTFRGCYRDERARLARLHKVWTAAGFAPVWFAH